MPSSSMLAKLTQLLLLLSVYVVALPEFSSFPAYGSLAGLSPEQVRAVARTFTDTPGAQPPPPAINDTSSKLVNDAEHPWQPLREGDIRGPCPGLNTLASHGYLPRNGVATPAQIINAVQEGFNMGWEIAVFATYTAFMVDGNHLTNLMSIGSKTPETGVDAPPPATIGGLDSHGVFEGDASLTRGDFYFGDNHSFNETLFEQLAQAAQDYGNGIINITVAAHHRKNRILDSMARNPTFNFLVPRYITAYAETGFPIAMFISGQDENSTKPLTVDVARSFFEDMKYPDGFYRRVGPMDLAVITALTIDVVETAPFGPGVNQGAGNFIEDPQELANMNAVGQTCYTYHRQANTTASLYPNATGELLTALKKNMETFYQATLLLANSSCAQVFPFGQ